MLAFIEKIQAGHYKFICRDFRDFDIGGISEKDFVYADPPYLITCATYNEKGGWNSSAEVDLLKFLDKLHNKGIKFALSNVLRSKGKENKILLEWLDKNAKIYRAVHLKHSYSNSNYHKTDKNSESDEVLILNYEQRQVNLLELEI